MSTGKLFGRVRSVETPAPANNPAPVNTKPVAVNTKAAPVNTNKRAGDRHAPGYMAEYMRKHRKGTKT